MLYVIVVLVLALLQYSFFSFMVGSARGKFQVNAPAVTGHEVFERYYRVQQNTLEQLIIFIPALLLFATYAHALSAAVLGVVYLLGRQLYYTTYIKDPKSRGLGFVTGFLASHILLLGALVAVIMQLI
ncbi:MAPEG family protein [Marinicella sp. S1101]|uniref:MAPEG family protein n=1 Tax=Marinicella marina TaxID=2996016 RepID=UPI002260DE55|nr:MAPEG family protein [Marinicella marina]MCX7554287.1 MAPEG family protein [Marinicella marina]MDJ1138722.1 MAPEG family protein [Marinicella marina]